MEDSTPPSRSNGQPTGTLSPGTTLTIISLTTNETATCKYSTTPNTAYASMANTFSTTGTTSHSTTVSGLENGGIYTYYVRCEDAASNANPDDYPITFSVAEPLVLHGTPADETIRLTWTVNTALPVTSTWRLAYDGLSGDQPSPISGIISPTRAYTLTGLTNYAWYTVTLNAMVDETSWLSDTVRVMPTDRFVYLPVVMRAAPGRSRFITNADFPLLPGISSPDTTYWASPDGQAVWTSCRGDLPLSGPSACALSTANTNASAGDTVYLRGGTYSGQEIRPSNSGTFESNRIVFTNYDQENVLIRDSAYGIYIYKKSYITVNGVTGHIV